jgi:hypothetical protein
MTNLPQIGQQEGDLPKGFLPWYNVVRVVVLFVLGVALIIYAAVSNGFNIPYIVSGLVLVGLVPIELVLPKKKDDEDEGGQTGTEKDEERHERFDSIRSYVSMFCGFLLFILGITSSPTNSGYIVLGAAMLGLGPMLKAAAGRNK